MVAMEAPYSNSSKITDYESFFSHSHRIGLSITNSLLLLLLYPTLVALFRYQRLRQTLKQYPYATRRSFSSMTNEHAFYIQQIFGELEFPFTYEKALQFALFRTYGIPSVSKLLVQTSEFSEKATATKRYVDTTVLVGEFAGYHPQSERSIEALGRMNFIHHQYRKCGKILDDDMLYTLSLFAGEPIRWIDKYEWRKLEDFEKCAMGTFWKAIGDAMGIGYEKLKSGGRGGEGWRDGLEWLEEVMEWGLEYEKQCMVPDENNRQTAEQTVAILLWGVPMAMKSYGRMAVSAIMDDRLRTAIIFARPPQIYFMLVSAVFTIRKLILRYLFFPRPSFLRVHGPTDRPSEEGRYFMNNWETVPWYVKPTIWNRWFNLQSWKSWIMGLPVPGDGGEEYWPKGYKIHEIGPRAMRGKGEQYARDSKEKLVTERMRGCPFERARRE